MLTRTLAILLLTATPALAIQGQATVIDGDTIEIHGERIRIHGVDAPESYQLCYVSEPGGGDKPYRCGQHAAMALADHLARRTVTCLATDTSYGRVVARCSVSGSDIAAWLVTEGHALDWPRYSKGEYDQHQQAAKAARKGIWASRFALPWERRRDKNAALIN